MQHHSEIQCSAWGGWGAGWGVNVPICLHLGGRADRVGVGESIREEWEVPVLQSSGLGGI